MLVAFAIVVGCAYFATGFIMGMTSPKISDHETLDDKVAWSLMMGIAWLPLLIWMLWSRHNFIQQGEFREAWRDLP